MLMQMCWHIQLMYPLLLIHGDGLWLVLRFRSNPKLNISSIFAQLITNKIDTNLQASDQPFCLDAGKLDKKIAERIEGELLYLNGASFFSSTILNKTVAKT